MSDFWSEEMSDLGDNLSIAWSVTKDVSENLNPLSEQFLSGNAMNTAREVEEQLAREQGRAVDERRITGSGTGGLALVAEAGGATVKDVGHVVADTLDTGGKIAGSALDLLTNKWVLGGLAALAVLAIAAPYVAPVVARVAR